jgi:hypothetical protein
MIGYIRLPLPSFLAKSFYFSDISNKTKDPKEIIVDNEENGRKTMAEAAYVSRYNTRRLSANF